MISALLTTTLVWAAGLLAYGLLLRSVPAHGFRRGYLLLLAGIRLTLPWLPVARPDIGFLPSAPQLDRVWLAQITVTGDAAGLSLLPDVSWLAVLYVSGLALALAWTLYGAWRLVRCFGESRPVDTAAEVQLRVRETGSDIGPFSYGRTLFVSDWAAIPAVERRTLLRHETAHYRLGHRFDNLAMTTLCTLLYFHPLAHLLRRELRLVHEYQADRATLAATTVGEYRRQLLAQHFITNPSRLVAAFAQRPLQSRFDMMTKRFCLHQAWRLAAASACFLLAAVACSKDDIGEERLVDLEAAQAEGLTSEDLFMRNQAARALLSTDTIEIFDPETGETTVQYVRRYAADEGKTREFSGTTRADGKQYAQIVRGQEVFRFADQMPHFAGPGCADDDRQCNEKAMLTHIYSNVTYPASAKDAGIEGRVIAQFVVGTDGAILEPTIVRSPDEAFSEEVLRILREMPEWTPGRQDGKNVQVNFVLPVQFRLE